MNRVGSAGQRHSGALPIRYRCITPVIYADLHQTLSVGQCWCYRQTIRSNILQCIGEHMAGETVFQTARQDSELRQERIIAFPVHTQAVELLGDSVLGGYLNHNSIVSRA
ncbi:hypothetical protein D3C73_763020 [compost metagenome]